MTTKVPIELSSTPSINDGGNATAITIDSSERVGIGTNSPSAPLTVNTGSDGNNVYIDNNGTQLAIGSTSSVNYINTQNGTAELAIQTNGTERMRIASDGQVMIGHSSSFAHSDADNLAIGDGTNNSGLTIYTGASKESSIIFGNAGTNGNIEAGIKYFHESHGTVANRRAMTFATGGSMTERMRIDSSGQLFLGKTSGVSGAFFQVAGDASNQSIRMENAYGTGIAQLITNTSGQTFNAIVFENSGQSGSISVTTSSTAYNTSSDYRLKENVTDMTDATTRLKQLKPKRFNFKSDETNTLVDGFLAHEVSSIVPEAITGEKDAVDGEGNPEYQGIDQSKLVPLLVKTIQELEARITALES